MKRHWIGAVVALLVATFVNAAEKPLELTLRQRVEVKDAGVWEVTEKGAAWDPTKTAVIICDLWDVHWCKGATSRVGPMAPRIDQLAKAVRSRGGLVIHAPSDTMKFYEGTPQRRRAMEAPKATPPSPSKRWNYIDKTREAALPIDDSDGGCDCDPQCKNYIAWKRQHAAVEVADADAVSQDGQEMFNLFAQRGIKHILICGVHTNMCVLGRSFGIRQMTTWGFDVALVRDLTDTMYNPRKAPFVPHDRGTDLVVQHVETYWCPTVHSSQILGDARPPTVVFAIAENEYNAKTTLPEFAKRELEPLGIRSVFLHSDSNDLPGTEALKDADLLVIYMRRKTLPPEQLDRFKAYFASGKPVIGVRTASHAFQNWLEFDPKVLGGNYTGHHGKQFPMTVSIADSAAKHPLLRGVAREFVSPGSLYKVSPLKDTTRVLMMGRIDGKDPEPAAWTNTHNGGKVVYTSLGHPDEFSAGSSPTRVFLKNAVLWTLERPIAAKQQ